MQPDPERTLDLAEDAERHRRLLNEIVDLGADIARHLHFRIMQSGNAEAATMAQAFDRTSRAIRRTVLLARKLAEAPPRNPARIVARKRILRTVEDAIDREADPTEAETLRAELVDRLDAPDIDDDIECRAVDDIIADIASDLGLSLDGQTPKRRTPGENQVIVNLAERRRPSGQPACLPPGQKLERSVPAPSPATRHRQRGPARIAQRNPKRHPS